MSQGEFEILDIFILLLLLIVIILRVVKISIGKNKLESVIKEKLDSDEARVVSIDKLSFKERIRYGTTPIDFLIIYQFLFGIISGKLEYTRVATLEKKTNDETTYYVSLTFKNGKLLRFQKLDTYDL